MAAKARPITPPTTPPAIVLALLGEGGVGAGVEVMEVAAADVVAAMVGLDVVVEAVLFAGVDRETDTAASI